MYEKINGKFYKLVDESEVKKLEPMFEKIKTFQDGIATCDKSIEAFNEQKKKYIAEINKIIAESNFNADDFKQLMPDKVTTMGF